jgi:hypothetical protein
MADTNDFEHIESVLRSDLERTRRLYKTAVANFRNVTRDIPSGLPHPDGMTRIRQVTDAHNRALDAYRTALRRFNDYAIDKTVPDDLTYRTSKKSSTQI